MPLGVSIACLPFFGWSWRGTSFMGNNVTRHRAGKRCPLREFFGSEERGGALRHAGKEGRAEPCVPSFLPAAPRKSRAPGRRVFLSLPASHGSKSPCVRLSSARVSSTCLV